jgi:hypothetical protein
MSLGLMFWIIMLILILFFGAFYAGYAYVTHFSSLVELVLFGLLGWQVFGPPLHR